MKEVTQDFGRRVVRQLILLSPPSGQSNKGNKAKKALEERITRDILGNPAPTGNYIFQWSKQHDRYFIFDRNNQKIPGMFVATKKIPKGLPLVNPQSHLSKFPMKRGKGSMYRNWKGPRPVARLSDVKQLVARKKKQVGRLAGGWNAAATSVGIRPPAWISRHGSGGGTAQYRQMGWRYMASYSNKTPYSQSHLEKIAQYALFYAENGMKRNTATLARKLAKQLKSA